MVRLCVALISLLIGFAPHLALAQESALSEQQEQQLVGLIEAGKQAYDRGEFDQSLARFREAYDIYQHPDIIYRIALCHERLGEDQQAVQFYRQFLTLAPQAPERPRIEKTIAVIEARIAKSEIRITTSPAGATIFIDDEANGIAGYSPTALAVKPGNYTLIVQKDGFEPLRELVTVSAGQSVQVRYQLDKAATPSEPGVRKKAGAVPSVQFLTLASIGVAAGITSVVFFGLHSDRRAKLEELDLLERQDVPRQRYEQLTRQKTTNLVVAVSSAAVSAFALIWAYGTWVSDRNAAHAAVGISWENGPVVTYGLRF